MISPPELETLLKNAFPDADIQIQDRTGMQDHYIINIVTKRFVEVGVMDRHRMVMEVLHPAMADGRLHAAEIKTGTP